MIFAPRSCPSSPGLATTTRILRAPSPPPQYTGVSRYAPQTSCSAAMISPSLAWARAHRSSAGMRFASARAAPSRSVVEGGRDRASRRAARARLAGGRAACAPAPDRSAASGSPRRRRLWKRLTPTTTRSPGVDLGLQLVARVRDLALREVLLDGLDHPAELVDPAEVVVRELLEAVGERLDEVRAAERVDRVRDARLVRDDLLRAQRDLDGLLGRQRERLVVGVRVQRLRAAEHARRAPRSPCG